MRAKAPLWRAIGLTRIETIPRAARPLYRVAVAAITGPVRPGYFRSSVFMSELMVSSGFSTNE